MGRLRRFLVGVSLRIAWRRLPLLLPWRPMRLKRDAQQKLTAA